MGRIPVLIIQQAIPDNMLLHIIISIEDYMKFV